MHYYFTADLHLGHENIITYCDRPFKNIYHMDNALIRNWNRRVKPGDIVFNNGDFCFKNSKGGKKGEGIQMKAIEWEAKLNGKIIHIKGNHDKNNSVKSLIERLVIKYGPHYICIVHHPKFYDTNFKINFVGHIHNLWKFRRVLNPMDGTYTDLINIGVDVWKFQPVTFEEIYKEYKRWTRYEAKIKWFNGAKEL